MNLCFEHFFILNFADAFKKEINFSANMKKAKKNDNKKCFQIFE